MKDEPNGPPDLGSPSQSPLHIDQFKGRLIVVERRERPDIPEGKGRSCPQCGECAWRESRFCWNCQFDFDRDAIPRLHPKKLLLVAISINVIVLAVVVLCHLNVKGNGNPTRSGSGSTPTSVLALAGTLKARMGAYSMTEKRKVDVSGIWAKRPSSDVLETQAAQRRTATRVPLVSINHIERSSVVTIQNVSAQDLAALLAPADRAAGDVT